MAHLAVVGSHSTNGVAALHSRLLRARTMADLAEMYPERFNNKTNGVTPRRWLLVCNPALSRCIRAAIGDGWITDLGELRRLAPLAGDASFQEEFRRAKRRAKAGLADFLARTTGERVDPDTIFDCQVKRIHEYKRQLLNALHVAMLYDRLRRDPALDVQPRTFLFAGKAAPAYALAKHIIHFINAVGAAVEADPATRGRLKVVFVPNYGVTVASHLIPAADVSEQISTAGYEASGTSNMKFMMNGALTIGTRDGATVEMAEEAGEENLFLFGLTADEVERSRAWYDPRWHYHNEPEVRAVFDLVRSGHFDRGEPGVFAPILEALLDRGDPYMHLADFRSYAEAQGRVEALRRDPAAWARKAILNVAASGRFSSDRTVSEYAREIWGASPCPVT
jgi:starch phosphorylase